MGKNNDSLSQENNNKWKKNKKRAQGMFRNISNPSIKNDGNNNSSATYPSFNGNQTKFKFTFGKSNLNENNNNVENNPFKKSSNEEFIDSGKVIDLKTKQKIQNKLKGIDNKNEKEIIIINKGNDGRFESMKDILIKNRENQSYENKNNNKIKNNKKLINNKRESEEESSNKEKQQDSNNESQKINKKNYKYISPNNIVISPTSNNEIKYSINHKGENSKEDEDQNQRIDRLINSIKTNQNTIRKSYGMIDVKINNSPNNANNNIKNKKNKKEKEYLLKNEENKNLYYNNTDENGKNSIEINKYILMYFCYLINHYMKRKVFMEYAKKIANYEIYLEKKFSLKILNRVIKKRIIFYQIKFLHRYKKIYKYLLKNNIDTISQIYSEESSSYFYDSEKCFNRNNQKSNKIEKTHITTNNKKNSQINKKFKNNKVNNNKNIKTIKTKK